MNVNQKIETALSDIVSGNIWPLNCPLENKPDIFIVYEPEKEIPDDFGDDQEGEWIHQMAITWFARPVSESGSSMKPVNYIRARKEIREKLEAAGFTMRNILPGYEKDTGYTTCILVCEIAEEL